MDQAKQKIMTWIIVFLISAGIFCAILFTRHSYNLTAFLDSCTYTGVFVFLSGALALTTSLGAFDIFVYGFHSVFSHMNPDPTHVDKYKDYVQYQEAKRSERQYHKPYLWPFFIIGGAFLIAMIVLLIISKNI
jgi:hypothetical protein